MADNSNTKTVRTVCRECSAMCGMIVIVKDGRAVSVEDDPESPKSRDKLCWRAKAGLERLYHPDRLHYPLKRTGERGEGKWQRITWDEAEKMIADGDLAAAHAQVAGLRQKYADRREVNEHANALEDRIREGLDGSPVDDASILELAIPPARLTTLECSPQEGFLLSRVNGSYTVAEIIRMVPGSPFEVRLTIDALMRRAVLRVKDGPTPDRFRGASAG